MARDKVEEFELMTAEEADALYRRIQLEGSKDPENFVLPGGRTLAEVNREAEDAARAEGEEIGRLAEEGRKAHAAALPREMVRVSVRGGQVITQPVTEPAEQSDAAGVPVSELEGGEAVVKVADAEAVAPEAPMPLSELPADFPSRGDLVEGGYGEPAKLRAATDEELLALPHIGPKRLGEIREALKTI